MRLKYVTWFLGPKKYFWKSNNHSFWINLDLGVIQLQDNKEILLIRCYRNSVKSVLYKKHTHYSINLNCPLETLFANTCSMYIVWIFFNKVWWNKSTPSWKEKQKQKMEINEKYGKKCNDKNVEELSPLLVIFQNCSFRSIEILNSSYHWQQQWSSLQHLHRLTQLHDRLSLTIIEDRVDQ